MHGTNRISAGLLNPGHVDPNWHIAGTGDFNGNGTTDILWQHTGG